MTNLIRNPRYQLPASEITPEAIHRDRRRILKAMGFMGMGALGIVPPHLMAQQAASPEASLYPAPRNEQRSVDVEITPESDTERYNNFYEFTTNKSGVWRLAENYPTSPWEIKVDGLVERPLTLQAKDLISMFPLEERVYRFRCVEAWSMVVPWTGFPMKRLLDHVQPKPEARFLRFESACDRERMPGVDEMGHWPWPYQEALTLEEASNDLAFLATGIYGHELPMQHGAPIRAIVPWKYGYKSPKSLVRIELTAVRPATFWNTAVPDEYSWFSNVEPEVPHPRWSQATERQLGTGRRVPTLPYNGYADQVAHMY